MTESKLESRKRSEALKNALCRELAKQVPALASELEFWIEPHGAILAHCFFADVSAYVHENAEQAIAGGPEEHSIAVRAVLEFLDSFAQANPDEEVESVLLLSFIEHFEPWDKPIGCFIRPMFGPTLSRLLAHQERSEWEKSLSGRMSKAIRKWALRKPPES